MIAPVSRLSKNEIIYLASRRCKHGHTYLEHYQCFIKEVGDKPGERICFWDIEANDLVGDYGRLLSWSVKGFDEDVVSDFITKKDIRRYGVYKSDTRIVKSLINKLLEYDRAVGHYSGRYDMPMLRTRAVILGIPFPTYGSLYQGDTWRIMRNKFKLRRNTLDSGLRAFIGSSDKTHIDAETWDKAQFGDPESIKYVVDHNEIDVIETEKLWLKISPYVRITNTSI